ncbi:hypothetical protein SESBI_47708 [Sesbania bispinosa]|nr:hypothetical protein SESBI_47708 [Sesbania bispinosa]
MAVIRALVTAIAVAVLVAALPVNAGDTNRAFSPCMDTRVQRSDGFTFGIAFASKDKFFYNNNNSLQLSPCDSRLSLSNSNSQISVFRPKVDEISLLTVNSSSFVADSYGYMVAFAGRKYAARSLSLRKVGCKIYIGKEMGVLNARVTPKLSVSTIRTVHYKQPVARAMEELWTVALEYNWHFLAQINTFQLSTLGMK